MKDGRGGRRKDERKTTEGNKRGRESKEARGSKEGLATSFQPHYCQKQFQCVCGVFLLREEMIKRKRRKRKEETRKKLSC